MSAKAVVVEHGNAHPAWVPASSVVEVTDAMACSRGCVFVVVEARFSFWQLDTADEVRLAKWLASLIAMPVDDTGHTGEQGES